MWRTINGNRVLDGDEARVFIAALTSLVTCVQSEEDYETGVELFDSFTSAQRCGLLVEIGFGLLDPRIPCVEPNAANESAVAAVFRNLIALLEGEPECSATNWRDLVDKAFAPIGAGIDEDLGESGKYDWDSKVELLQGQILWDADYEMGDQLLDMDPERSARLRQQLTISDDYYAAVPDDPTEERARQLAASLLRFCAARLESLR